MEFVFCVNLGWVGLVWFGLGYGVWGVGCRVWMDGISCGDGCCWMHNVWILPRI